MTAIVAGATASGAQSSATPECTYATCALGVAVRWNGLAVVRGQAADRVATLNFFVPRSVSAAFTGGNDAAKAWATRAVARRRTAAVFTDIGLALMGAALIPAVQGEPVDGGHRTAALAGALLFGISVPIQFSADNALSRAVWFYNQRFNP